MFENVYLLQQNTLRYLAEKKPQAFVNQFPFENVITVKDLLAIVCRRVSSSMKWLPITYNLKYELAKFVSYFQERENADMDNFWIVKPWNLARSIDTYVTKDLNQIIRLQESSPKVL
jgi:tubulin--tyrosine ligase-like protein 12